jgi:hypothetical protein
MERKQCPAKMIPYPTQGIPPFSSDFVGRGHPRRFWHWLTQIMRTILRSLRNNVISMIKM